MCVATIQRGGLGEGSVEVPVSNLYKFQSSETSDLSFQERLGCKFERLSFALPAAKLAS